MTKPMANPSPRAQARRRLGPTSSSKRESLSPAHKAIKKLAEKTRTTMLRATSVAPTTGALSKLKSPDRPLTDKQKLFIKHWAAGDSILGAAYQAGYSDSGQMAYRMVHDPAILKLYNEEKKKYEASVGMTRERVMNGLVEAIDMARTMADPNAMVAGWREVGKMCGYYAPVSVKVDVSVTDNTAYGRLNRMSDAELLELAKKDRLTIDVEAKEVPQLQVREEEEAEADG